MTTFNSKSLVLKCKLEEGIPGPEHFDIIETTINESDLTTNGIIVKVHAMSADPFLRKAMKGNGTCMVGQVLKGFVSGEVIVSQNPLWQVGDLIGANLPLSMVQIVSEQCLSETITWKLTGLVDMNSISWGVHALGMTGATAYGGLSVLKPKEGETLFISSACGAVGSMVGMLAKNLFGCKVIGSCGGAEKCKIVTEKFGFDHAIDYKSVSGDASELIEQIMSVAPDGIDMYFDCVGGMQLEASLKLLKPYGRIALCGQISQYNKKEHTVMTFDPMNMIWKAQRIEGFLSFPWLRGEEGNFLRDMRQWLAEGKVGVHETVFEGIEQWPVGFQALFTGDCCGKVVIRV